MESNKPLKLRRFLLLIAIITVTFHANSSFSAQAGSLYITSEPKGATVYLDNNKIGTTDIIIGSIPAGSHSITLELAGYQKVEGTVTVSSGLTTSFSQKLTKGTGRIQARAGGEGGTTPVRKSFFETINPWIILLIFLILIGITVMLMIFKVMPRGRVLVPLKKAVPISKAKPTKIPRKKPAHAATKTAKTKTPSKPLKIPTPVKGIKIKDAPVVGNYRVIEKIAAGGMANIYKATHIKKGGTAILKVPYEQFQNDQNFIERFRREAELGKKLHHENIIRIYESGITKDGLTYIAMEYMQGIDLRKYLNKYGSMPIDGALRTITLVCRALDYAHVKGVIHRDIKPENIMLPDKKGKGRVVLMDFGVAHAAYLGTVGTRSTYLGTPFYMSPDISSGQKVDARSDIYSLGVVFFEMITGQRPFNAVDPLNVLIQHREAPPPNPSSLNREISPELETIVLTMLAKKPSGRYQSAEELLVALQEYMLKEDIDID
jgi:tRNA A-37 threonylcarbamoyl transferase component Bud32